MNGTTRVIDATRVEYDAPHGIVWDAVFAYPDDAFLADMDWKVFDANNRIVQFEAYSFRKLIQDRKPWLHIRFRDRDWTPVDPAAKLFAQLHSPSS